MKRPIVIWPDPILSRRCEEVPAVTPEVQALLNDMVETMHAVNGIGLAAPQVGFSLRLVVLLAKRPDSAEHVVLKLVNPKLIELPSLRGMTAPSAEGCLSFPGTRAMVERLVGVRVEALDESGAKVEIECDGQLAQCLQHELEHLEGITLADHVTVLKREVLRKKYTKAKKRGLRYNLESPPPQDFTQRA